MVLNAVLNFVVKLVDIKNQIQFGEITQYAFESLKFPTHNTNFRP